MINERREATVLADVPRVIVGMDGSAPSMEPAGAFVERARELIDRALSDAFGTGWPSVPVVTRIVESGASAALLDEAKGAALLVVGSRGLGGLRGMLGSTSRRCVTHATCPVLVVRPAGVRGHGAHETRATAHRNAAGALRCGSRCSDPLPTRLYGEACLS